jgi:hypothetical protein
MKAGRGTAEILSPLLSSSPPSPIPRECSAAPRIKTGGGGIFSRALAKMLGPTTVRDDRTAPRTKTGGGGKAALGDPPPLEDSIAPRAPPLTTIIFYGCSLSKKVTPPIGVLSIDAKCDDVSGGAATPGSTIKNIFAIWGFSLRITTIGTMAY